MEPKTAPTPLYPRAANPANPAAAAAARTTAADDNDGALITRNTKGAWALTPAGLALRQRVQGERGGALVALAARRVGPRASQAAGLDAPHRGRFPRTAAAAAELHAAAIAATTVATKRGIVVTGGVPRAEVAGAIAAVLAEGEALSPAAAAANLADLIVLAFETLDVRAGLGERTLGAWLYLHLLHVAPTTMVSLLRHVPHYGSWRALRTLYEVATDDLNATAPAPPTAETAATLELLRGAIATLWARQLMIDDVQAVAYHKAVAAAEAAVVVVGSTATATAGAGAGAGSAPAATAAAVEAARAAVPRPRISLAGKWAPRIGSSPDETCGLARHILSELTRQATTFVPPPPRMHGRRRGPRGVGAGAGAGAGPATAAVLAAAAAVDPAIAVAEAAVAAAAATTVPPSTGVAAAATTTTDDDSESESGGDAEMADASDEDGNPAATAAAHSRARATGIREGADASVDGEDGLGLLRAALEQLRISAPGAPIPPAVAAVAEPPATDPVAAAAATAAATTASPAATTAATAAGTGPSSPLAAAAPAYVYPHPPASAFAGSARVPDKHHADKTAIECATEAAYRHMLSRLNRHLETVEVRMSARHFSTIDPLRVPAGANRVYRAAFQNVVAATPQKRIAASDRGKRAGVASGSAVAGASRCAVPDRVAAAHNFVQAAIASLASGEGGRRIKGAGNQPHQIISPYLHGPSEAVERPDGTVLIQPRRDPMTEAMWDDLVRTMRERGTMPVAVPLVDVSGSMSGLPMEVAIAMGLLLCQLAPADCVWHKRLITFTEAPEWHDVLDCADLASAVASVQRMQWGGSTNFGGAMRLLLDTAVAEKLPPDAMPRALFVFSDMEFDAAAGVSRYDHYGVRGGAGGDGAFASPSPFIYAGHDVRAAFADAGYTPPQVVFWNLRVGGPPVFQAESTTPGVSLMSGFSPQCLATFLETGDLAKAAPPPPPPAPAPAPAAAEADAAAAPDADAAVDADGDTAMEADGGKGATAAPAAAATAAATGGDASAATAAGAAAGAGVVAAAMAAGPTPWDTLCAKLESERYDRLRLAVQAHRGETRYVWLPPPEREADGGEDGGDPTAPAAPGAKRRAPHGGHVGGGGPGRGGRGRGGRGRRRGGR